MLYYFCLLHSKIGVQVLHHAQVFPLEWYLHQYPRNIVRFWCQTWVVDVKLNTVMSRLDHSIHGPQHHSLRIPTVPTETNLKQARRFLSPSDFAHQHTAVGGGKFSKVCFTKSVQLKFSRVETYTASRCNNYQICFNQMHLPRVEFILHYLDGAHLKRRFMIGA